MATITPEQALEMAAKIGGARGLDAIIQQMYVMKNKSQHEMDKIARQIELGKQRALQLEGSVQTFQAVIETLEEAKKEWGLVAAPLVAHAEGTTGDEAPSVLTAFEQEAKKRQEEAKLCMWRDRETKKWCQRSLRTKDQKAERYCSVHFERAVGRAEKHPESRVKKSPRKKARK